MLALKHARENRPSAAHIKAGRPLEIALRDRGVQIVDAVLLAAAADGTRNFERPTLRERNAEWPPDIRQGRPVAIDPDVHVGLEIRRLNIAFERQAALAGLGNDVDR